MAVEHTRLHSLDKRRERLLWISSVVMETFGGRGSLRDGKTLTLEGKEREGSSVVKEECEGRGLLSTETPGPLEGMRGEVHWWLMILEGWVSLRDGNTGILGWMERWGSYMVKKFERLGVSKRWKNWHPGREEEGIWKMLHVGWEMNACEKCLLNRQFYFACNDATRILSFLFVFLLFLIFIFSFFFLFFSCFSCSFPFPFSTY